MSNKPKNERHHWWPQALSKFWADDSGLVHRLEPDGKVLRSPPKSFGAIRNDNNITYKNSPTLWDTSFEKVYAKADDGFPWLIEWLKNLHKRNCGEGRRLSETADTAKRGAEAARHAGRVPGFADRPQPELSRPR